MRCGTCGRPVKIRSWSGRKPRRYFGPANDGHDLYFRRLLDSLRSQRIALEVTAMADFDDDFSDLNEFAGEFQAQPAIRPDLKSLPDGSYDFEILDAELTRAQNGNRICSMGLRTHTGAVVQHTYWLNQQIAVNRMGYDFGILGIDTSAWAASGELGKEIAKAVKRLPGLKFRGVKSSRFVKGTNGKADATYHDLSVTGRMGGGKPMPKQQEEFAF